MPERLATSLVRSPLFQVLVKPALKQTLWREGSVRRILRGPSRGLRYRIFPGYGWSAIHGGWEPRVQALFAQHLGAGGVAYDVGANYGIHTLLMARLTGAHGQVHAFEPMPAIMAALRENVGFNGFQNVTFVQEALNDSKGELRLFTGAHDGAGHLATVGEASGQSTIVQTVTLDEYVLERDNPPPTLIKMDVEGAESRVIAGGRKVLASARPVLIVDLHGIEQEIAVGQALAELRYRIYRVDDGRPIADVTRGHDDPDGMADEILAVPSP